MQTDCGIVGLGIMGSAIAGNLISKGMTVAGYDVDPDALRRFADGGGQPCTSAGALVDMAPVALLSLPSRAALQAVTDDIVRHGQPNRVIAECSTLAIDDKHTARRQLATRDMVLLDCPLSGSRKQAETRELTVFASGEISAVDRCRPVFDAMSRATHYVGPFGNGMKMKLIANLLVAIHNTATAEALALAESAGLEPRLAQSVIADSPASSRMFELRGPMMAEDRYEPPGMTIDLWRKDLDLIGGFASALGCDTPLFALTEALYREAEAMGLGRQDTAAIKRVLDRKTRDDAGIR